MSLDDCNTSELVLLAQDNDPEAHRGLDRETLKELILSEDPLSLPEREVNKVRLKIMQYVRDHWIQVQPLLTCPARSGQPDACFVCPDIQAVECATKNHESIFGNNNKEKD